MCPTLAKMLFEIIRSLNKLHDMILIWKNVYTFTVLLYLLYILYYYVIYYVDLIMYIVIMYNQKF